MSRRLALVVVAALALVGALAGAVGAGSAGSLPTMQSEPLTAAIYEGSCRRPESTAAFSLNELTKPDGEAVRGLPFVSETELDAALPALQSDPYALIVARDATDPDNALACGDLNSVTTADGSTMLVGLFEQKSSLYTGIAVLTANEETTTVRVYVARALTGGFGIEGPLDDEEETDAEVTESASVTVNDDEVVVDRTEFAVGSTVEFTVVNEGQDRHEIILEERGANEEPLETDDGEQAETEDLGPEEEARFVYTFEDEGAYQLADHIGEHFEQGLVVEILTVEPEE